jgi:excisionase family DNA binding protein
MVTEPFEHDRGARVKKSYPLPDVHLLTLKEAAGVLRISSRTFNRMILRGKEKVPAFKVGGQWRLRESAFMQWIEGKAQVEAAIKVKV